MPDMGILVALFLTDTLLFQDLEKKLIKPQIKLSSMIFKLMIGSKCHKSKKEDIIIQVVILTINLYTCSEAFKTQIRSIHVQLKESILT